jgi:hypothetical protein
LHCASDDEHVILKLSLSNFDSKDENAPCIPGPFEDHQCSMSTFSDEDHIPCGNIFSEENSKSLKVVDLLQEFEEKTKNNEWPQTTSIHCYWCCHKFDSSPFGVPLKFTQGRFKVYGCFCSLECATSYNFDSKESYDEIWERHNLINLLARKLGITSPIEPAPTRLALCMFGGHLSIEEFRAYSKTSKVININFPPMMTVKQQIEETNKCDLSDFRFVPVDTDRIKRYKDGLFLKRSKPIHSLETTLDHTMNLRFGTTST